VSLFVGVLDVDLHIPECRSLKAKRAVLKPIVEGIKRRYACAAAEVDHQNKWQRARVGVAVVASSEAHASDILDEVERFVWSHPDVQVLQIDRRWMERET
jgi:uncharacterized protein YlxP (DUF503 family)